MNIRLLLAVPDAETEQLMTSLLDAAMCLVPLDIHAQRARNREEVLARVHACVDDVVMLDWGLAGPETPALVESFLQINRQLRVIVLLPQNMRQYRQQLWQAGACSSIPKEYLDQEWISSALCIMNRAMEREARLIK